MHFQGDRAPCMPILPPGHKIQPMSKSDLEEVLKIERRSFQKPWSAGQFESEIRNPVSRSFTLRIEQGGSPVLVAYIIFWVVHGEAHILNIAVKPEYRRMGIAAELLREALEYMRGNMVFEVFLEVRRSNAAARGLYAGFGFKEAYERKNYYGDEDAIVMTLEF